MTRVSLLLGIAVMLAVANTYPGSLLPYTPGSPNQSQMGASPATGGASCVNCSDIVSVYPVDSPISAQPTSPSLPTGSAIMASMTWATFEQDGLIWRGKVRSRWESLGFDSSVFELFMRMKGAKTRFNLLDALTVPKDRMQLAQELGLDWKAVDYQMIRLHRHGMVHEDRAFGNVKLYRLTTLGEMLLRLLRDTGVDATRVTGLQAQQRIER